MINLDPDFKALSDHQRELALKCLYCVTRHSDQQRASGLTQIHLVHAIGTSLLGVELDLADASMDDAYREAAG